jgi:YggT family protein
MYGNVSSAGVFLINSLFDLYILVLIVRLILAFAKANYFNPVTQVIIKLTQPLVAPLRRFIPNYRGIEFSTLVLIILFEMLKFLLLSLLTIGMPTFIGLFIFAILDTLKFILKTFFYAILLQAILSWFQPGQSPAIQLLQQISAPILRPFQRMIPPINGIDISAIPALILLQVLIILL